MNERERETPSRALRLLGVDTTIVPPYSFFMMKNRRQRHLAKTLLLLLLLFILAPPSYPQESASPKPVSPRFSHWVPAEQAVIGGRVQEELLDPAERVEVHSWLRPRPRDAAEGAIPKSSGSAMSGCDVVVVTSAGAENTEVAKALDEATFGLLGTVSEIRPGLFHGRIAALVSVQVDQWIKAPAASSQPASVHFIYDDAALTVDGMTYCRRSTRKDRLTLGRRVFLASSNVLQEAPLLLLPYDRQLFFETAKRNVSAPGTATAQTAGSWADFEEGVKRWKGEAK